MPSIERGVFHVDGEPVFLLSGDYPYYRDRREHWRPRLDAIARAGVRFVTAYVPWRHHAPTPPSEGGAGYDFDGHTQPNRDVRGFVRSCADAGLRVILKPGPFVHGELRYGGLPDHVDPSLNLQIEPERDGSGEPYRWEAPGGEQARALPAPLDETFCLHVRDWLASVTRELLVPFSAPGGPIVAVQILNEGIYSDSANGLVPSYGYSASSGRAWARFLRASYGTIERYNDLHESRHTDWTAIPAPASVSPAKSLAPMLNLLDRSRFTHALYADVIERYAGYMWDAGLDRKIPLLMNFCPNIHSFRRLVASNDGWLCKVAWRAPRGVHWAHTDWIGVAQHDPRAFLQYVLCAARERGPNVEENWGFSGIYDPSYSFVQPSYFQSLLSIAAGATGLNIYTMVGTSAWRDDHNIDTVGIPRVAGARPPLDEDYPGHAAIASDGSLSAKYWTIAELARYLDVEGASLVGERRADLAWAVYPPYAWAGAWAPSGDEEEAPWLAAGLRAMPRVAYRGLEALIETAIERALDVAQVNVFEAEPAELRRHRCLVLAGYEMMDRPTQERLVAYVEEGGALLLTGIVPTLGLDLKSASKRPLRTSLFDHARETFVPLAFGVHEPIRASRGEEAIGLAERFVVEVTPPEDATVTFTDGSDRPVGYAVRRGAGIAIYAGFRPWFTAAHADDPRLVAANRMFLEAVVSRCTSARPRFARAIEGAGTMDVNVWQYGAFERGRLDEGAPQHAADVEHVAIVSRAATPGVREIEFTRAGGEIARFRLALVPNTACLLAFERGVARSVLLKCVNDHDRIGVPPFLEEPGGVWSANAPCDLCVTRPERDLIEVMVAHAASEIVDVELPVPADRVLSAKDASGREVWTQATRQGIRVRVCDMRLAGIHRIQLR